MKTPLFQMNLVLGWIWLVLGFASGFVQGLFFQREEWLGGYGSFKRRMYRLAHISFFGLGTVNVLFHFTVQSLVSTPALHGASWAFGLGAVTMPICCVLMANHPKARLLFGIPVFSLLAGGILTVWQLLHL